MGWPSLEMLAVDQYPCGCFWNVCQDQNPAVENLEGSVPVARESNSIIKSSHQGPFFEVSGDK